MTEVLGGKVAVITGSGRGIGRATALSMAEHGAKVVVNDLGTGGDGIGSSSSAADEVVAEIRSRGGQAVANYDSVASAEGAERIVNTAIDEFGKIDVLVNIAGILRDRILWNMTDEEWDAVVKVHLYGHFYCTRAAVRLMRDSIRAGRQKNGRIINFTSGSGLNGNPGQPNYSAAKMGVVGFTYSIALACQKAGITCNAIAPQAMTRMTDTIPADRLRELVKHAGLSIWNHPDIQVVKKAVLGGDPSAVSPLVVWLTGDEAQHVTGQVFGIHEGYLALYPQPAPVKLVLREGPFDFDSMCRAMGSILPHPVQAEG